MKPIWILIHGNRVQTYENSKIVKKIEENYLTNIKVLDPKKIIVEYTNLNSLFTNQENSIKSNKRFLYNDGAEIFELEKPLIVFPKFGCMMDDNDFTILQALENDGIKLVNGTKGLTLTQDKAKTVDVLYHAKINTINSTYFNATNVLALLNDDFEIQKYPIIMKSKNGSLGMGIYKLNNKKEFKDLLEHTYLLDSTFEFLLQEYVESGNVDYRVVVINGEINYVIKRVATNGEFRANYALNSTATLEPIDPKMIILVAKIYELLELDFMGIDLFKVDGEFIVCEINSNPGWRAYNDLTGKDYTNIVISALQEIANLEYEKIKIT